MKNRTRVSQVLQAGAKKFGRIVVLTGARQTGKTTLVRHAFEGYQYLSIEDPVLRKSYTKLTAAQWMASYPKAILDEIQKEPVLIESIKATYDQFEEPRYILLGSSQILLMDKVKESLAGRSLIIEMYPLTLPELMTQDWEDAILPSLFQQFIMGNLLVSDLLPSFHLDKDYAKKQGVFEYYLNFGGYPALTHDDLNDEDRYTWLLNYIKTYLERDVRDLADMRQLEPFMKVQQMVALQTATLLNFSKLANEAGVTSKTAQQYLQYLELSYQAFSLKPWHRNNQKRLVKTAKVHMMDPGVMNAILNKRTTVTGNEFESAIVAEIYKQLKNGGASVNLYHFRTHDGREVDLLLETEKGYIPIEIKMSTNITPTDARHLVDLDQILDKPIIHAFILSNDSMVKSINPQITAIPAAMFLT